MKSQIEQIAASEVFDEDVQYVVPMYQRNFAWDAEQIERLLDDVNSINLPSGNLPEGNGEVQSQEGSKNQIQDESNPHHDACYYLGMLVVDKSQDETKKNCFEVIDGQQRLTTLHLLATYLNKNKKGKAQGNSEAMKGQLEYESRTNYKEALDDPEKGGVTEISDGYKIIEGFLEKKDLDSFCKKLDNVFLLRVQVPKDVNLNHYFEIMNTRGEQLEPHQIAKARILAKIRDAEIAKEENQNPDKELAKKAAERKTRLAAMIWDACSDMDSYVQMNFKKSVRDKIFGEEWSSEVLNKDWDSLVEAFAEAEEEDVKAGSGKAGEQKANQPKTMDDDQTKSLKAFLEEGPASLEEQKKIDDDEGKTRFESILSFPNFLLQARAVDSYKDGESDAGDEDPSLDDKKILDLLKDLWETDTAEPAENFLVNMLKRRFLFDKYILKREFTKEFKADGQWSLKRLERYKKGEQTETGKIREKDSENYVDTFGKDDTANKSGSTKKLKTLQSALRITYTAPKSMRWITKVLKYLDDGQNLDKPAELTRCLETYCVNKIKESDYKNKSGFAIEHIVFSYLDYLLLYSDKYGSLVNDMKDTDDPGKEKGDGWEFQFRPSIEHFFPRNSYNPISKKLWEADKEAALNCFGNLALISKSGNSVLSNEPPSEKITRKEVINQSIKLKIMAKITEGNGSKWEPEDAINHGKEMMEILDREYPDN